MKREYIFLVLIFIILYLLYLIVSYKYKEYQINYRIDYIENINTNLNKEISNTKETLEYINTKAYKNKILKEEQSLKNKGEIVIFITNEENFNKYTKSEISSQTTEVLNEKNIYDNMTIFQKWIYFLFKKDIR